MDDITGVLKRAAADAEVAREYNTNKQPCIRPSRAGLPLVQLILEDTILPKLPQAPQRSWSKADPYAVTMRLSNGYLFEKAVEQLLMQDYSESLTQVIPQEQLTLDDLTGSCDMLVVNHSLKQAIVVECKALKAYTLTEVKEQKLMCDNWGYFTQLALYTLAIKRKYPDYNVFGEWYVWLKPLERHMRHKLQLTQEELEQVYAEVVEKSQQYAEFNREFNEGKLSYAVSKLMQNTVDLPHKIKTREGYTKGSCSLHFNRYCDLITNADGTLADTAEDTLLLLTRAAYYGENSEHQKLLLELLTKAN